MTQKTTGGDAKCCHDTLHDFYSPLLRTTLQEVKKLIVVLITICACLQTDLCHASQ